MDDPKFRKKHLAKEKKRDKGLIYASSRHVRIELENLYRHEKKCSKSAHDKNKQLIKMEEPKTPEAPKIPKTLDAPGAPMKAKKPRLT